MAVVQVPIPTIAAWSLAAAAAVAAVIFLVLATISAVEAVREWLRFRRHANRFPCKPPKPFVGHLFDCGAFASVPTLVQYLTTECMRLRTGQALFGPFRNIFIADPRDIQVFVTNSKNQDKTFLYKFAGEAIGNGLVSISGQKWRRHHKIIAPAFYTSVLESLVPVFNRKSDVVVENLREYANGCAFDVAPFIEKIAFDIICETAVGMTETSQNDTEYYRALEEVTSELVERIKRPWLYPEFIYRLTPRGRKAAKAHGILRDAQRKGIRERASKVNICDGDRNEGKTQRHSFIDLILEQRKNGASISDEEITEEIDTLMFTGFDTVKLTVGFALIALSQNPTIQEKIVVELQNVFGTSDSSTDVSPESLRQMPYLEQVIKETLRVYPPVWFFARKAGIDIPLVSCDLVIPAGADVIIPIKAVHMDPQLYTNPEIFDPDRFSAENTAHRHPYGFLPFGSGQRICIGRRYAMLEAKTILAKLIWNYEVLPEPTYKPEYTWGITSPPTNGMWIKLQKRSR